jgi:hypothetical protein
MRRIVRLSRFDRTLQRLVAVAIFAAMPAASSALTWPGPAPCNTTLQACIEGAADGDVLEVATDGPIAESVEIFAKNLTLRPAEGFTPVFEGMPSLDAIEAFGADTPVTVSIEGMTVRGGFIRVYQRGSGAFTATIRGNVIEADALDFDLEAIGVSTFGSAATGPVGFLIYDNEIRFGFLGGDVVSAIDIDDLPGDTFGLIIANRVVGGGPSSVSHAIRIRNGIGSADIEATHNRIEATGYNGGFLIEQDDAGGTMTARVFNNLVTGSLDINGPQPGAIVLRADAGSLDATVLNNTLAGNATGFAASVGAAASLTGVLANTIVAGNTNRGVKIDAAAAAHFSNEHNLVFGNGSDDFTPGPGTILADPRFVGGGDFHPVANSPVRDAGNTSLATDIDVDLDGSPRVLGAEIDIGAWELSEQIFADGFDA